MASAPEAPREQRITENHRNGIESDAARDASFENSGPPFPECMSILPYIKHQEIVTARLPALRKVLAATDEAYQRYVLMLVMLFVVVFGVTFALTGF